ncbi:MAG TPA: diaminopimelate epimerase [Candidatus Hydrogenedentes bacterium]|nr:diaminopimelate epimerase [Candidatus Hydrogenedentota bacterium]HPG69045.1 diaminopimelate epimerase [Candidatus Hydrogenedentota bacterium]
MRFTKMHGLGNDYLFIQGEWQAIDDPAELSRRMSHRHLGVGADGIILVLPSKDADFAMRIFNADGSEAETCGNGIRCFAKYVYEREMTDKTDFVIDTLAGPNGVRLTTEGRHVLRVRSNMGQPRFERSEIPMIGAPGRAIEEPLDVDGETYAVTCANIGNPHAVVFVDDATAVPLAEIGPKIENHPRFPQRTNVEFVNVVDRENIVMRIWERGSGITMASGSGSCGAALASMITERVGRRVRVHLVYGILDIEWAEDGFVYQEGPATEVFSGTWQTERQGE